MWFNVNNLMFSYYDDDEVDDFEDDILFEGEEEDLICLDIVIWKEEKKRLR